MRKHKLRAGRRVLVAPYGPVRVVRALSTATMLHHGLIIPILAFHFKGDGLIGRAFALILSRRCCVLHSASLFMFPADAQRRVLLYPPSGAVCWNLPPIGGQNARNSCAFRASCSCPAKALKQSENVEYFAHKFYRITNTEKLFC